jgi:type IV pilus assembly protein PilY1
MKPALQFATAVIALGGLLFQATSHATDLAEQPLKASVLAKPNVIFGVDDSGSMDSEVMLYNNDGAFWWNYSAQNGWGINASHPNPSLRTITTTHFNSAGDASSTWRKMVYLFPNGTGTGRRVYGDASNDHFAIMPTSEFAFLRWSGVYKSGSTYHSPPTDPALSPVHNPIYYNPLMTYAPWARAQISTGPVTPVAATPSAVKSHPMNGLGSAYLSGSGTFDLTASPGVPEDTADNKHFIALPGMTIPVGAQISECSSSRSDCSSTWSTVTSSDKAATASKVTRVAMAYFPATYWVKENCTVDTGASVGARACATAPDGSTLRRYEIKSGNTFPSGRSYTDELQNFANWMQYYRKRKLMLAGAMGETMETLTGMRLGVVKFNSHATVTMYDADATSASSNRLRVAGIFYETNGDGGTPTRETLKYIGNQFMRTDMTSGKYNVMQYACQRNNAFVVTDGFANASAVTLPDYDDLKNENSWGSGAPYHAIFGSSLADVALRYYTNNVRKDLDPGVVPKTTRDLNPDPHMNTYGLTMGARGTLFLDESVTNPTSTSAWPNPSANRSPTSVDDLWHATINGRGKMYLATTPEETALRIQSGLNDIKSQVGAQSSVAISSFNLLASDGQAYAASYNPSGWTGDLTASSVNVTTGAISSTVNWSADTLLRARTSARAIVTSNGSTGIAFTSGNVGSAVNNSLVAAGGFTNDGLIAYLRGNRTGEGDVYRTRTSLIGAVLNAEPVVDVANQVVYLASGEGMLHAFNTATGAEEWAFVPYEGLAQIGQTALREYTFKTKLDGTPTVGAYAGGKLLVAGMGAAGRSYYAIDVTSPRNLSEADAAGKVKWSFPGLSDTANQALMGYSVGRPLIVKTKTQGYVALVTSGYDGGAAMGDGKGRLWMLNASTGAVIRTFVTSAGAPGAEAGLAQINAYRNEDGTASWVYGGDLLGNLWKFDLDGGATTLLAVLKGASGAAQPVTTRPQLTRINNRPVVMVGTGRLLDIGDFGSSSAQTVYAISDDGTGVTLPNARAATTSLAIDGNNVTGSVNWNTSRGWHLDIPAGQQVNVDPKFVLGYLHVNANTAGGINCAQSASHYKISVMAAGASPSAVVGSTETLTTTANVMSPVFVQSGDKLFRWIRNDKGDIDNDEETRPSAIAPRKNSWREISR